MVIVPWGTGLITPVEAGHTPSPHGRAADKAANSQARLLFVRLTTRSLRPPQVQRHHDERLVDEGPGRENELVNAPTCPACGYLLRWFATPHHAWGCDRCQALIPSASPQSQSPSQPPQLSPYAPPIPSPVQDHPSQPYSPFRAPEPATAPAAPPKKSRKGLFIGLSMAGVLVVGGIVAFAVLRDDKRSRSRDAVIEQTFAALAAGDEQALYELADPAQTFTMIARCEKRSKDSSKDVDDLLDSEYRRASRLETEYRDPDKVAEHWRKDVRQLLRRTKGAKLEVVDILTELPPPLGTKPKQSSKRDDDDDKQSRWDRDRDREDDEDRPERDNEYKTTTFKKGHELMRGCYAKMPFRRQQVKVVVDVKEGEREFTQRVRLVLHEIDGNWYLAQPPSLNVGLDVIVADVEQWRDKTCKCTDAACVEDLDEESGHLAYARNQLDRDADLPRETMARLERVQQERKVCEGAARGGPELARYKELKDQVCACKEDECARKIELEMVSLRSKVEANVRRARIPSYEVTRQVSDLAMAASECTRKLALQRVQLYAAWPTGGEQTGGTLVTIRGSNLMTTPRTAKVWFGTKEATGVRFATDRELVVEAPPQEAEGFVELRVQFDPGGTVTVPYGFTYRAPQKPVKKPRPKPATP